MPEQEKTLGIILRARAEFDKAAADAKGKLGEIAGAAKTSSATAASAAVTSNSTMQDAFRKTGQAGTLALAGIGSVAAQLGGALGPVQSGAGAVFAAFSSGVPILVALNLGLLGLGAAFKFIDSQIKPPIASTNDFAAALARVDPLLVQTTIHLGNFNIVSSNFKAPDLKGFSGDLTDFANRLAHGGNSLAYFDSLLGRIASAPTMSDLRNAQQQLGKMITVSDSAIRAFAISELEKINGEIERLNRIAARGTTIEIAKPDVSAGIQRFLPSIDPDAEAAAAAARKKVVEDNNATLKTAEQRLQDDRAAAMLYGYQRGQIIDEKRKAEFLSDTQFMQSAFGTAVQTMTDFEMTGSNRIKAIRNSLVQNFIMQVGQKVQAHIFGELAIRAADQETAAVQTSVAGSAAVKEIAAAASVAAKWLAVAATKIYSFYAALGPFGLPAAAATIVGMIAAIKAVRLQQGGVVPGSGFGDKVPAFLEPREFVVNRRAAQQNLPLLQAINSGTSVVPRSSGNTFVIQAPMDSTEEFVRLREQFQRWLVPAIERAVDEGKFRRGFSLARA